MTYPLLLDQLPALVDAHHDAFEVMYYQLLAHDDLSDAELDAIVTHIATPIFQAIDCRKCGNCCATLAVYLTPEDAHRLAQAIHIPIEAVMSAYIETEDAQAQGEWGKFRASPCAFLSDKQCTVYPHRPQTCRDYPFLTPDFRWMLPHHIAGAKRCPILYHTLCAVWDYVEYELYGQK